MIRTDERAGIVLVVPDALVNPGAERDDSAELAAAFDVLVERGAGVTILPPRIGTEDEVRLAARDLVDYLRHGYAVGAIEVEDDPVGSRWRAVLDEELRAWDHAPPEGIHLPAREAARATADYLATLRPAEPFAQHAASGLGR